MIAKPSGALIALVLLSGCAGWVEKSYVERASKACVDAGYTMIHPQYSECERNTVVALKERDAQIERQSAENALAGALILGAAYGAAQGQAQSYDNSAAPARPAYQPSFRTYDYTRPSHPETKQQSLMMCPDGSYVSGDGCHLAVDGSYHGGPPSMAPDGTYVVGRPRMTPDGTYVGGSGEIKLCPDGTYVGGNNCHMAPDGSYVGVP